ncbi:MAG: N-acetylmuramoyl-L-alanine amidase [Acetanaerobacterium sp.]
MPKVCIDPGHGAQDSGSISGKRLEKNDNLALALRLDAQFRAQRWQTLLTRDDDSHIILAHRTALANTEKCDLFLSCHRNGFVNAAANGAEIWLHSQAPQRYKDWAADILARFAALGFANRGVKLGYRDSLAADYAVNRNTNMPSMLLELGFVTSDKDNALFDDKPAEICEAIVRGCCTFSGVAYTENVPTPPVNKTYTLDVPKLKGQGFDKIEIAL